MRGAVRETFVDVVGAEFGCAGQRQNLLDVVAGARGWVKEYFSGPRGRAAEAGRAVGG